MDDEAMQVYAFDTVVFVFMGGKFNLGKPENSIGVYNRIATGGKIKFERSIPQPAKVQKSGGYSTKMRMTKAAGGAIMRMKDFVQQEAS